MDYFGKFDLKIENVKTGKVTELKNQNNLILNSFFSHIESASSYRFISCLFGSGSQVPAISDTSLQSKVDGRIRTGDHTIGKTANQSIENSIFKREMTCTMTGSQGEIIGNISELGLSYGSSESELFTRALIRDSQGQPTTITLTEFDVLTVVYTIGYTIDLTIDSIAEKTIDINGVPTLCTLRWLDYNRNDPDYRGLWGGVFLDTNSPLYPAYSFLYMTPINGTITDYGNLPNNTYIKLGPYDYTDRQVFADGTYIGHRSQRQIIFGQGDCTGVWTGLVLSSETTIPSSGSTSKSETASAILEFDPPIDKGENDVLEFTTFEFFTGRA